VSVYTHPESVVYCLARLNRPTSRSLELFLKLSNTDVTTLGTCDEWALDFEAFVLPAECGMRSGRLALLLAVQKQIPWGNAPYRTVPVRTSPWLAWRELG